MANFILSPKVEPNEVIELDRAFFPDGHRGVLDLKRQLVVGNRGMGKSFWTHALLNAELRQRLASVYCLPALAKTDVVIGFNGSEKIGKAAPTIEQVSNAFKNDRDPELIWRAVLLRAARSLRAEGRLPSFDDTIVELVSSPQIYAQTLTDADDELANENKFLIVVFDALDRLGKDWGGIRQLTKALLTRALGLQSFRAIRAKIFMRVDQFFDPELFRFPDSSKIRNDYVSLLGTRTNFTACCFSNFFDNTTPVMNWRPWLSRRTHALLFRKRVDRTLPRLTSKPCSCPPLPANSWAATRSVAAFTLGFRFILAMPPTIARRVPS